MTLTKIPEKNFKVGYVAIVGQPNVGKSTLLNHFLSFKMASVTRKPQTTRHQIKGILNGPGHQVVFLDTPGLLEPRYKLQEAMLQAAHRALQEADLALFMIEAKNKIDPRDQANLNQVAQLQKKIILVINKVDLVPRQNLLPLIDHYRRADGIETIVPVSALKDIGLDALRDEAIKALPVGFPFYDTEQITDHPERFLVSEIIREKIFLRFGDEIPYSTTVYIEEFKERKNRKDFIRATIYVEKKSQKGILIGKNGEALKKIGTNAREDIETTLERSVFLELWVKVKEKWRENEATLKEFGYLG